MFLSFFSSPFYIAPQKNIKKTLLLFVVFLSVILSGCNKAEAVKVKDDYYSNAAAETKTPTKKDWGLAFSKSLNKRHEEPMDDDGVEKFIAVFNVNNKKDIFMSGEYDAFRHRTMLKSIDYSIDRLVNNKSIVPYVLVNDYSYPSMAIAMKFEGSSWIFMNGVSVMSDGKLVLDARIDSSSVKRNVSEDAKAIEEYHFILDDDNEINAISEVATAKKVIIRMNGKNVYDVLSKKETASFIKNFSDSYVAYKTIKSNLDGNVP